MLNNWGSRENFLTRGFGFVTKALDRHEIVSWSLCDCVGDDACEIGIRTHTEFRQQGLATLRTAEVVDHVFTKNLRLVGWHCNIDNTVSQRTALRAGFAFERNYVTFVCY